MTKNVIQLYKEEDYLGNEIMVLFTGVILDNEYIDDLVIDMGEVLHSRSGNYVEDEETVRLENVIIDYVCDDKVVEMCGCCGNPIYDFDIINGAGYICAYCNSAFAI